MRLTPVQTAPVTLAYLRQLRADGVSDTTLAVLCRRPVTGWVPGACPWPGLLLDFPVPPAQLRPPLGLPTGIRVAPLRPLTPPQARLEYVRSLRQRGASDTMFREWFATGRVEGWPPGALPWPGPVMEEPVRTPAQEYMARYRTTLFRLGYGVVGDRDRAARERTFEANMAQRLGWPLWLVRFIRTWS